jgi:hypothetical protein
MSRDTCELCRELRHPLGHKCAVSRHRSHLSRVIVHTLGTSPPNGSISPNGCSGLQVALLVRQAHASVYDSRRGRIPERLLRPAFCSLPSH